MAKSHILRLAGIALVASGLYVYLAKYNSGDSSPAGLPAEQANSPVEQIEKVTDGIENPTDWFSQDFSGERQLLTLIRNSLVSEKPIEEIPALNVKFNPAYSHIAITLFEAGRKPLRFISKRTGLPETVNRIISKLREKERFTKFDISDPDKCRIMFEIITGEQPLDITRLNSDQLNSNRYEPGITGFKFRYNDRDYIYMPTDAVVNSHLTPNHALNFISKKVGIAKQTNKISERVRLVKALPVEFSTISSIVFVTYGREIIPLYRGYPMPVVFSRQRVFQMAKRSVDWIYDNITEDGRFLYYYEGIKDTVIDHVHPNRTEQDNYYNILRHSGGVIALLRMHELTKDDKYITAVGKTLDFLIKQVREHPYKNGKACYVYFNKKAKLGGTGIALVALLRYQQTTGDTKYNAYIRGMARHLLSRIAPDGEMIGYYIHPLYNEGRPITSPTPEEKKYLFSF